MSLNSVATPIWNEIAETQELATKWGKMAFRLDAEKMSELINKEYRELKERGLPFAVIKGYLDLKPLLLENVAISRHIQRTDDLSLRSALPEVTTIDEAVMLASQDQPLTLKQQEQLSKLLSEDLA